MWILVCWLEYGAIQTQVRPFSPPERQSEAQAITQHRFTNRLVEETSPYLLQHAHNPVDWHPWGSEAIEMARESDLPIFLSIGYSTCYWCHVMERECFEDESIAVLMNRGFVNVKMDREQRPDVDEIFMTACQVFSRLTTGRASGGWPLSVFLDPFTLEPFFVGTYFPPRAAQGRPSFPQVLEAMSNAWREQREDVRLQAARVSSMVRESLQAGQSVRALGSTQVDEAVDQLMSMHDREHGGFGSAPKFPQPVFLELLMQAGRGRPAIDAAVSRTLDAMASGGIYDQVGGGFHRYSVDEMWLVPHFEKMLYDNGQLASVYATACQRGGEPLHRRVLEETLDYVLREMTDPGTGMFFSAQDAEVDTHEGRNYLWTREEFSGALREAGLESDLPAALEVLGLSEGANFQDPHHPGDPPANVLHLVADPDISADPSDQRVDDLLARVRPVLYASRMQRDQPGLDDKVISGWNGLMIRGMADGGRVLGRLDYVEAAERAARSVLSVMGSDDGGLMRTARNGRATIPAFLEDYAFLARACLALHLATEDRYWQERAVELVESARSRFWGDDGAWYDTMAGQSDLLVRSRNLGDGAIPSGIGTMLLVLAELAELTGEHRFLDDLESALARLSGAIAANPVGSTYATMVVDLLGTSFPERLPTGPGPDAEAPVRVSLVPESVSLDPEGKGTVVLRFDIDPGHHINAHQPGRQELLGLKVGLLGVRGLTAEVDYPGGDLFRESILVHARSLELPVVLHRTGPITGEPVLAIRWQACTDELCLPPVNLELPLQLQEVER